MMRTMRTKTGFAKSAGRCLGFLSVFLFLSGIFYPGGPAAAGEAGISRRNAVVRAVESVSDAVVNISSEYTAVEHVNPFAGFGMDSFFRDFFERRFPARRRLTSLGSGVIIDGERGFIITNEHVIAKTGTITVVLKDGREFQAEIVGADPESDLAVLQIESDKPLPSVPMGDSSDIMIGETVIAIGNPFGFSNSVTTGVVSAVNRSIKAEDRVYHDFLQTDASINPGNSGGPLLNIEGELIGINTAIYAKAEGIGFAIPINQARKIVSDLIDYGQVVHAWVGLTVQDIDPRLARYLGLSSDEGIVVKDIEPTGPAAEAGIREGDVIRTIGDQPIRDVQDYESAMRGFSKGEELAFHIRRNGREKEVRVEASVFPRRLAMKLAYQLMGVEVVSIEEKRRFDQPISAGAGVIVSKVRPGSRLAEIGARQGDVIRKINEINLETVEDFKDAVIKYRWKDSVVILLQRGERGYYITLELTG
jgi:Do/DeqQ family serine protease